VGVAPDVLPDPLTRCSAPGPC